MRNECWLLIPLSAFLTCLILMLAACSSDDKSDKGKESSSATGRQRSAATGDDGARKSSATVEEFISKKKDMALKIYAARADGVFDPEETIELTVEIYSPRHLAFKTYWTSLGDDHPEPVFSDLVIGSKERSWEDNLTLFSINDNGETPVSFASAFTMEQKQINLGQGEIGSLSIITKPGLFSSEGDLGLRLKYADSISGKELTAETSVILKRDYADKLQRNLSTINYLRVTGKRQEALNLSLESVNTWPESYRARVQLGQAYEEGEMLHEALAEYRRGVELYKDTRQDRITEYPKGLWDKIKELETKLEELEKKEDK